MAIGAWYKQILGGQDGQSGLLGEQTQVYDYDSTDFDVLWSDQNGKLGVLAQLQIRKRIVIVWDGSSNANADAIAKQLKPHLTPLDWALAFSIKLACDHLHEFRDGLGIHIIDLTGRKHDEWAMQMRHTLLAEMPWVKLYAPLIPDAHSYRNGYRPIVEQERNGHLINGVEKLLASSEGAHHSPNRKVLIQLAKQWAATLTHSEDHHDINNILGPYFLGVAPRESHTASMVNKLRWGMQYCRVERPIHWRGVGTLKKNVFGRQVSVLVIDDQLHCGWDDFSHRLFGIQSNNNAHRSSESCNSVENDSVKVTGYLAPDVLIEFLQTRAVFTKRNYQGQISQVHQSIVPEIVFLDLRLYANDEQTKRHARNLIKIAREKVCAPLAWPAIAQDELQSIEAWCEGACKTPRSADEALLLLPRLLALALPLTPIILFSSSGQSWIRERLKSYQNILTGFEKPRVLSNHEAVEAAIGALHQGLDKAVEMMRLRLQLAHAQQAAELAENEIKYKVLNYPLENCHIELYVDEGLKTEQGIISGMAFCVFTDKNEADSFQNYLQSEHKESGAVWAKNADSSGSPTATKLGKGYHLKGSSANALAQSKIVSAILEKNGLGFERRVLWSAIATRSSPHHSDSSDVSLATFPDASLDDVLRFNIEFALFALIPYFLKNSGGSGKIFSGSISIQLASRVIELQNKNQVAELANAFDIPSITSNLLLVSPKIRGFGAYFPLIRGWLHGWKAFTLVSHRTIKSIKTTTLSRGETSGISSEEAAERRLFHDIADWICAANGWEKSQGANVTRHSSQLRNALNTEGIFQNWYTSTDNTGVENGHGNFIQDSQDAITLMSALRAGYADHFPMAETTGQRFDEIRSDSLRIMLRNSNVQNCHPRLLNNEFCAPQRVILWSLLDDLEFADGPVLHSLLAGWQSIDSQIDQTEAGSAPTAGGATAETVHAEKICVAVNATADAVGSLSVDKSPLFDSQPLEKLISLTEDELTSRHPSGKKFKVVFGRYGPTTFLSECAVDGARARYHINNRRMTLLLGNKGWSNPVTVWAVEEEQNESYQHIGTMPLRVLAAKLVDGLWLLFE